MGTVVVKRAARRPAPEIPAEQLVVEPPPEIPEEVAGGWKQWLMALPMLGGTLAMAMMMGQGRGGAYSYVIGGLFGVSSLAMMMTSFGASGAPRKAEMMSARREYLRHLASLRKRVRETARLQRVGLLYRHPDPERLWSTVGSHRVWERRAGDPDFGVVRVGVGPQTLATPLMPPVTRPLDELEPMTAGALRRFLDAYSVVPDLPVAMSLRGFSRIYVRGDAPGAEGPRALVRAVLTQLAVFHAPDDLVIAVCAGQDARSHWEWVKWLPHAGHPGRNDALGAVRLVAGAEPELAEMLEDVLGNRPRFHPGESAGSTPHVLVVIDGAEPANTRLDDALDGLTVLDLDTAPPRLLDRSALVLEVRTDGVLGTWTMDHDSEVGRADGLTVAGAEAVARRLAPLRLAVAADPGGSSTATETGLPELIGIADAESFSVANGWPARPARDMLRVPIGVSGDGMPVELDIKESAQDGMGPHGLLIGATGSGKSELLKTLVLALAATHSSEVLNFILIDFKGGAAFAAMDRLPHTAAVVTNLEHALPLVDRMADALEGEMARRQEVLSKAGNYASLYDYERARAGGAPLAPLPTLFIVCDEFTEMLKEKQDFIEIFLQIGRLGRSLGVHLLLASQRLEDGRLRGLDTHLSYRIGLRTFSALESRAVLGVPDAYELPKAPGNGYLKFGTEPLTRFKAAYVSGSIRRSGPSGTRVQHHGPRVLPWSTQHVPVQAAAPEPQPVAKQEDGPKLADVMVDRIVGQGPPAHQVWLPPLEDSSALDELLGPVGVMAGRGLTFTNPSVHNRLQVPIAIVDKPREQLRDVMWLHLAGAAGHVAVVGGTLSGKSTALRTLICGLALTHTPAEVQIYCMDFGGGSLGTLRDLPHVGGVFSRLDTEGIRRTAGEMITLLAEREARFAELGVDSMASYRSRRAGGNDPFGDVFLVIDGWSTIRKEFDELEPVLTDLATRGLSYGIHLVAASSRWMDFRSGVRDLFGSRLELRLGDPTDSVINHRAAKDVPENAPGRGMIVHPTNRAKGLHLLTVRPEISSLGDTAGLVKAIAAAWEGQPAPRVRLLPPSVPYTALNAERGSGLRIPIGIAEANLQPVEIDFASDPHFLLFGDAESGKSSFLRSVATTLTNRFQPEECRIILVDYRRSLIDIPQTEHRIGYGMQAEPALQLIQSAAAYMERRLPGPDVTARQLRDRSWWTGPELFVLVDDYDLVVSGPTNPLTPLVNYLAQARDIGLHLVLTRRSGGASRALFEPVIQKLRELSMPGLVMSGSPEEGALIGNIKPIPLPPGRGRLITRREGTRLIQLAHQPPFQDSGK
ncbi:type VII secretion protein EccCa [Actinoplanes derwentensis]|uniref:DNA segregation ATPase FtsK/SpoIIIE, S-DNA-T family n=1 Tax=Actinoplanes derwentensis TaxID=113562 RepID=A0A1H2CYC9_9ACTN|nr:type VII secretion protein EccCa [Actinoplanes derwentensis]GID82878.1 type VII secretion protein EccC [Actinoplanes derwentensis]SDT75309.1 DNA segregation ATPase FtsK/SpoIIIE, S-DNA-T family [Actinoplanes derwentensis]